MHWLLQGALALAIGVAAVAALVVGIMASRLVRLALRPQQVLMPGDEQVPPEWRARLAPAGGLLAALGFHCRYSIAMSPAAVAEGDALAYMDVYAHDDQRAYATVQAANPPDALRPCLITFSSVLTDGRLLVTSNGTRHHQVVDLPGVLLDDGYCITWREAWQLHQRRMQDLGALIMADPEAFVRVNLEVVERMIGEGERLGQLVRRGEHWFLSWRRALLYAARWYPGEHKAGRARTAAGAAELLTPPPASEAAAGEAADPAAAEITAFHRQLAVARSLKLSAAGKWKLFAVSAVLFLLVGSLWISWSFLPILLAVIALHEAGHFLAMKLSGYGNLSIFFVPGLGGLASGEKPDAGPWQKLFVYLAGPLPGLALAIGGLAFMVMGGFQPPGWFLEFLIATLVINYLNLLPFPPLDGGRVVEVFLFARHPRARFAFAVLGVAAFAGLGLTWGDQVLLVVAVIVAFALPHQWRMAQVDAAIARGTEERLDEGGAIARIFTALQQPRFARWTFAQRAGAATALLPELQGRRARRWEMFAGLTIYVLCLAAPLAVGLAGFRAHFGGLSALFDPSPRVVPDDVEPAAPQAPRPPERDWLAEAAHWQQAPAAEQLPLLLRAADQAYERGDEATQKRLLKTAAQVAADRPRGDLDRVRALSAMADEEADPLAGQRTRRELVAELQDASTPEAWRVRASLKDQLSYGSGVEPAERVQLLRNALADHEQARSHWRERMHARRQLARALDVARQPTEAEALLRQAITTVPAVPAGDRTREGLALRVARTGAQLELVWFLLAQGRPQDAAPLAEEALAGVPQRVSVSWEHANRTASEALVWARLPLGDAAALRAAWKRYDDNRQNLGRASRTSLAHEIDRLQAARALQDAGMEHDALAGIRKQRADKRSAYAVRELCELPAREQWQLRHQLAARRELARTVGVCAPG